jgi:hypothetical protein
MKSRIARISILFVPLALPLRGFAGVESILGKWLAKAETPGGTVELEIELRQEGTQLVGTAAMFQSPVPLKDLVFEEPNLAVQLTAGGLTFKLKGMIKDGKFSGTYEQVGGDLKGPWSMERKAESAAAGGISGAWDAVAVTTGGDLQTVMDVKLDGQKVTGTVASAMGSVPIKEGTGSYKDGVLQYDIEFGGNTYRIEAALVEGKFTGKWSTVGGTDTGVWTATRKAAAPAAPAARLAAASTTALPLEGRWTSVAITPSGPINFEAKVAQSGETVTGEIITPDGNSIPIKNGKFANNSLTFEIDLGGSVFRMEATMTGGKLAGKWAAIGGTDTGEWSATKKP